SDVKNSPRCPWLEGAGCERWMYPTVPYRTMSRPDGSPDRKSRKTTFMRSITIAALLTLCACALMGSVYPAYAQIDGDDFTSGGDTLTSDDSVEAPNADDIFFSDIEDDDFGAVDEPGFFRVRGGFFGGPIVEFTS